MIFDLLYDVQTAMLMKLMVGQVVNLNIILKWIVVKQFLNIVLKRIVVKQFLNIILKQIMVKQFLNIILKRIVVKQVLKVILNFKYLVNTPGLRICVGLHMYGLASTIR